VINYGDWDPSSRRRRSPQAKSRRPVCRRGRGARGDRHPGRRARALLPDSPAGSSSLAVAFISSEFRQPGKRVLTVFTLFQRVCARVVWLAAGRGRAVES
jgi:hypothetical protein